MPILDLLNRVPTPRPYNDELLPTQVQGHSWGALSSNTRGFLKSASFAKSVTVISHDVVLVFFKVLW